MHWSECTGHLPPDVSVEPGELDNDTEVASLFHTMSADPARPASALSSTSSKPPGLSQALLFLQNIGRPLMVV